MRARTLSLIAVVACLSLAVPAGAAPSVTITSVAVDGTSAVVTGTATAEPVTEPQSVGGTNTQFANATVSEAAGIDLTDGLIQPVDGGLRFIWKVKSLPDQVPPEGVRYTWAFTIAGRQYQLQAKRTNFASVTTLEDPIGHAQQAGKDFFQLRGACTTSYLGTPISGCYHLAFLQGGFDTANDLVWMELPYETRDKIGRLVAPDFKPGAVLDAFESAGMSIAANFQVVASTADVADYTNGWNSYFVGKVVQLGVGREGSSPQGVSYTTSATVDGDSFSGTVSGLQGLNNTVFVRACSALECAYASFRP